MKTKQIAQDKLLQFYYDAREEVIKAGYQWEIDVVENRTFDQIRPIDFIHEYVFVVMSAGMKNQVAVKMAKRYWTEGIDTVKHSGKKKAIEKMTEYIHDEKEISYVVFFNKLKSLNDVQKLELLAELPWIGGITKYHLARNLGIDVAKPDRHLVRLAKEYDFDDVQEMCDYVAHRTGDRIGTVDVVLWRYSNLFGSKGSGSL